jgi:quinol monooxygenase YgiN
MVTTGLLVRLEANPARAREVEQLLRDGLAFVLEEPATTAWFAVRLGPTTFGIFDAFPDEAGRQAHLAGRSAAALCARARSLAHPPTIEPVDVLRVQPPA